MLVGADRGLVLGEMLVIFCILSFLPCTDTGSCSRKVYCVALVWRTRPTNQKCSSKCIWFCFFEGRNSFYYCSCIVHNYIYDYVSYINYIIIIILYMIYTNDYVYIILIIFHPLFPLPSSLFYSLGLLSYILLPISKKCLSLFPIVSPLFCSYIIYIFSCSYKRSHELLTCD